jgi:ribose transport system ATP-binding protein
VGAGGEEALMAEDPLLALWNVSKTFQGYRALDAVSLEVRPGEVHALVGQNGSGKSTLIKILAGYHRADVGASGSFGASSLVLDSLARPPGLRFVHQDLGLISELNAVDNLALGGHYARSWWLSDRREHKAVRRLFAEYDLQIDAGAPVVLLTAAQQTMLALLRSIRRMSDLGGASLLVLDEVTASLPNREVRQVFDVIRQIKARGGSILYVTHRLREVFEIADRVTVLRDGRRVATSPVSSLDHDSLVEIIVGRPVQYFYPPPSPVPRTDVILRVDGVTGDQVNDVSFDVHQGEIVGVTGLVGSGYERLLALIFGAQTRISGSVEVAGSKVAPGSPRHAIAAGMAFLAADRKRAGAIAEWTLRENMTLPSVPSRGLLRWLSARSERAIVEPWLEQLQVMPANPESRFSSLSGGNQQKVVLARWLRCAGNVMLLEEPTNGVDIGARQAIYQALGNAAKQGTGVLMSSSDAEELCAICDRVAVMREGRITAILSGPSLNVDRLVGESMQVGAGI